MLVLFVAIHLACLGAIWTGVSWSDIGLCLALYAIRMFGVTGGYHRYFAHRAYKTGRVMQFLLAALAQSSLQSGALWRFAQTVGPAVKGAVTHPGAAAETHTYADI